MEEGAGAAADTQALIGESDDVGQERGRLRLLAHPLVKPDRPVVGVRPVEVGPRGVRPDSGVGVRCRATMRADVAVLPNKQQMVESRRSRQAR